MSYDRISGRVEHITEDLAYVRFTNKVSPETEKHILKFEDRERVAYHVTVNEFGKSIVIMTLIDDNIILGYN